jgi:hypothetical protein
VQTIFAAFQLILLHAMRNEHIVFDFNGHKNSREHSECCCLPLSMFLCTIDGFDCMNDCPLENKLSLFDMRLLSFVFRSLQEDLDGYYSL